MVMGLLYALKKVYFATDEKDVQENSYIKKGRPRSGGPIK
jgi:hypothetical protein